jgi:hypothetical protein
MDESSASDKEYDRYLDKLFQSGIMDSPFTEHEYRMLRAELESLVQMEEKFGYLLSEQRNRQHDLVACLLIDPSSLSRKNANYPKNNDHDEPPFLEH